MKCKHWSEAQEEALFDFLAEEEMAGPLWLPAAEGIELMSLWLRMLRRRKVLLLECLEEAWDAEALDGLAKVNEEIATAGQRLAEYQVQAAVN